MMRSKERHTLASIVRVFLHSAPKTTFRRGCFSTSHFRFLSKNSTLCSNTIRGLIVDSSKGAAVCKKSQNIKSKRSEEHTSELQSQSNLVCRLLLEKKKKQNTSTQSEL